MTDPELSAALFLDHVKAGIERLEGLGLSEQDKIEATRLAWRLYGVARKR